MLNSTGFQPIAKIDATVLILGSMPGQKSLEENQYYAHPRNSFWPIMYKLFNVNKTLNYEQRKKLLLQNKIALWDVLRSCYRKGSLDSNIDHSTLESNDFQNFFSKHKNIKTVFFNGAKAEQLFKKYVLKDLESINLKYHKLPSTSPAHATKTMEEKFLEWEIIKGF
jgi:double-stranded uracil-DNA glycosylase